MTTPTASPLPRLDLGFGWSAGLVPGVKAAWGARVIVTQDGGVDFLGDRTGAAGDPALVSATIDWMNTVTRDEDAETETVIGQAFNAARKGLREGRIHTRKAQGVVLYQDSRGAVIGNTNASAGYLYVAAFLFEALPDGHPTRGLEIALNLAGEDDVISP